MENKAFWPGWETIQLIGRGSFGAVYEIQRDVLGDVEKAALKVISIPQNSGDIEELYNDGYDDESITSTFQSHLKSIVAEYTLMRKMNGSSNIVNCDDIRYVQHDDGIGWDIFIKMELLTPLAKSLPSDIPEEMVIKIGQDICAALELCKKFDIVHRDIKPQNIFVSDFGDYKLGDFGIAKTVEKTMGGTKIGTYKYMAPEVYNNQPYGSAADIYSLGLVLYWLLNERRMPFMPLPPAKPKAGQEAESRQCRLSGEPLPAPAHGSDALKAIVLKACSPDPKDRFASAAEMHEALKQLSEDTTVVPILAPVVKAEPQPEPTPAPKAEPEPSPVPPVEKKKKKLWPIIAAACLAVCLIGGGLAVGLSRKEPTAEEKPQDPAPSQTVEETAPPSSQTENSEAPEETPVVQPWSDWSTEVPEEIPGRTVETLTEYRVREKSSAQTTNLNNVTGEVYDQKSEVIWGDWGSWQTGVLTESELRKVESGVEYRYRDVITTESLTRLLGGSYVLIGTEETYTGWSDWEWGTGHNVSATAQVEVQDAYNPDIGRGTYYHYCSRSRVESYPFLEGHSPCKLSWVGRIDDFPEIYDGVTSCETARHFTWFLESFERTGGMDKQYRYREPITVFCYESYGNWSQWEATPVVGSDTCEVETRTVYRCKEGSRRTTYYYWVYGEWGDWTNEMPTVGASEEMETRTLYRYQDS